MCLTCNAVPTPPAPKVDPATHSHHKAGSAGSECVSCHMPTTMYMQRHGRHDHGFTIPDPLLTKELGIPNACNRCHADQKPDWAVAALEKWGAKGQRLPRERTRVIARARTADKTAVTDLLKLTQTETNSFWRAVAANLLKRWADEPKVQQRLTELAEESEPLVRAMSLRALAPLASAPDRAPVQTYQKHLTDASRGVRIETAWALHATLDTNSVAGKDLLSFLRHNQDQPSGALQLGIFNLDRNNLPAAMELFQRALAWDTNSAPLYQALAVGLSLEGNIAEAVKALENACRIAPRDADSQFKLGLALNEAGRTADSRKALERAVQLEPGFAQAWYNLGLAWNAEGQLDLAIEALLKAESLEPRAAQFPYARATILAKAGKIDEAKAAARRALELEPGWADAQSLLQSLSQ